MQVIKKSNSFFSNVASKGLAKFFCLTSLKMNFKPNAYYRIKRESRERALSISIEEI